MHRLIRPLAFFALVLALGGLTSVAAQDATPVATPATVVSPETEVGGLTLGEWNARQWQWWVSFPAAINPIADGTGASCGFGQSGPVFFLAGIDYRLSPEYPCTVPEGVILYVPLGGAECSTIEPEPFFGRDEAELRDCAVTLTDEIPIDQTEVVIDGVSVGDLRPYRATSPVFTLILGEGNLFGAPPAQGLSVSDGYQVMVGPMTAGNHTIAITYLGPENTPETVTYSLTVVAPQIIEPSASPEAATPTA